MGRDARVTEERRFRADSSAIDRWRRAEPDDADSGERKSEAKAAAVPIDLQVIGSALRAVTDEMGAVLVRAAFSPNIKERRVCS